MSISEESTVLSSWKDIARYLGKGVRTVQRWEQQLGLPVRRPIGSSQKSAVLLHRGDVDAWLAARFSARSPRIEMPGAEAVASARSLLRERLERARELRTVNQALTEQLQVAIQRLSQQCGQLAAQRLEPKTVLASIEEELAGSTYPGDSAMTRPMAAKRKAMPY